MKNAGRSLFMSVIALVLCFSMLLGLTWAWFTDSATSDRNTIEAGNLDVELEYRKDGGAWKTVDENTNVFKNAKWEPGYTEVVYLRVKNEGSLALKYLLSVKILEETASINVDGVAFRLSDFIKIGGVDDVETPYNTRNEAKTAATGVKGLREGYTKVDRLEKNEMDYVALVLYIPESVGNEANARKGEATPKIDLGLRLVATQVDSEGDSFGSDFDKEVGFPALRLPGSITESVETDADGKLANDVVIKDADETTVAEVPKGVQLTEQAGELSFSVSEMENSGANITLADKEILRSLDVHIEGVATTNTLPIRITIQQAMMPGLNLGNFTLYHVEGGIRVAMTRVASLAELDAHNEFVYDPATGNVILSLATFSEVAIVADTENAWNGNVATGFAGGEGTEANPYLIANADQLAYLGYVISNENEAYGDKHYKLVANINLGGEENAANGIIFYPIGYTKEGGTIAAQDLDDAPEFICFDEDPDYAPERAGAVVEVGETVWYTYGGAFKGTFDGNGNKISNIYQNTWQMKGDYSGHYWNAAMGIFGYVYGGTVKNLTVDNFSSDGEFTPTGVVAAYAADATFENIAITNCNPRVYNTGNGGIVGVGGNSDDTSDKKMLFTNITVDNSNKISALWGSWDVACGGLMGMFRGYSEVKFTNCHVAAQIDVYNDVCGNYQYYWYRYAGMVIGSLRGRNTTDAQGYTVPDMTGISAENCTVHFGNWNDYYYCELVANSLASYTHDHQFSRLTVIDSLSEIKNGETFTTAGNFLLAGECYHIVKNADGSLKRHLHADAGTEVVNGKTVLKEDKQVVYLPFNQLFQGDGWGVKHVPVYNGEEYAFGGITILDREIANSLDKFEVVLKDTSIETGTTITLGEIFAATGIADINKNNLKIFVSPVGDESTVSAVYVPNGDDWTQGTLTFSGIGAAKIVITDYTYCKEAVAALTVTDHPAVDKFEAKGDLNFVHTIEGGTIQKTLGDIFAEIKNADIKRDGIVVSYSTNGDVTVEFVQNNNDWAASSVAFTGAGTVTFSITDGYYCNEATATVVIAHPEKSDKFEVKDNLTFYHTLEGDTISKTLGDIFTAKGGVSINSANILVTIDNEALCTYSKDASDWTKSALTFKDNGTVKITITDQNYCNIATATVTIADPAEQDLFSLKFPNVNVYLYRVGNGNEIKLSSLFGATLPAGATVSVTIDGVSGSYTPNSTWANGTIKFTGTGVAQITIDSNAFTKAKTLTVEVVDAVNATGAMNATRNNVVLLNDCGFSSLEVSGGYTLYGNGFTMTCGSDSVATDRAYSFVELNGGTLDNVQIVVPNFSHAVMYEKNKTENGNPSNTDSSGKTRYYNMRSAVKVTQDSKITNSYISGGRAAIYAISGSLTIENSTIFGGAVANIQAEASSHLILQDVTLIQKPIKANVNDTSKTLMGFSVVMMCDTTGNGAPVTLQGYLHQYAWANKDYAQYVPSDGQDVIDDVLSQSSFVHSITYEDGVTRDSVNLGFAYIPDGTTATKTDNWLDARSQNEQTKFLYSKTTVSVIAAIYTYKATNGTDDAVKTEPSYVATTQGIILPKLDFTDANENRVFTTTYDSTDAEWKSTLKVDVDAGVYNFSFAKLLVQKHGQNLSYTIKTADGTVVDKNTLITLNAAVSNIYYLTITDDQIYDANGNKTGSVIEITYKFELLATKTSLPAPTWTSSTLNGTPYIVVDSKDGDWNCAVPVLDGLKIKYWSKKQNKEVELDLSTIVSAAGLSAGLQNDSNNTITINVGDEYTLQITTSGFKTNDNGKPVVVNGKLYFTVSSSSNYVSTSTTSRNPSISYVFTDANNSDPISLATSFEVVYATYKGTQYKYSDFCNGTLTEATCVTADTLITLADGTQVRVDSLTGNEELLVWNMETGTFDKAAIMFVDSEAIAEYEIIHLYFSDGTDVKVISEHGFWDYDLNKYVYLDRYADKYIGHTFAKQNGNALEKVTLVDVVIETEYTTAWSPVTVGHLCYFVNGMLSMPGGVGGLFNIFEIDAETMTYDYEAMERDIATYGLYTYEELNAICPLSEDMFNAAGGAYLKISIGKGNLTEQELFDMINRYNKFFN